MTMKSSISIPLTMFALAVGMAAGCTGADHADTVKRCVSGIYPNLATRNNEGECGTGAVVPWAGSLWAVSYAPHMPNRSSDKLYQITPSREQIVRKESIGGTPADRMIHRESNQLFIGPYAIDAQGNVRVMPPINPDGSTNLYGRLTACARHLTDPANKIYIATMEEGLYEVDVKSLKVKELYKDGNLQEHKDGDLLPGYHGKGCYSGQGRVVYANNGELSKLAQRDPTVASGVLAQWNGKDWEIIRRNQFTDVTGPGGIFGNPKPATDPLWAIGWDYRSLILEVLDHGTWHAYRLPKGSHSYDGAHGWNTEWPRIREIGEGDDLLMTMHGTFWRFPKTFSTRNSAGIKPRSNYLKIIGDFCRWQDRIVMGCDDSAKNEFLNKRGAKGSIGGPRQSNSNLWFVKPEELDSFGPAIGRGAVWMDDTVTYNTASDPFLFDGYDVRELYLAAEASGLKDKLGFDLRNEAAQFQHPNHLNFRLEIDRLGDGNWQPLDYKLALASAGLESNGVLRIIFKDSDRGAWIRLVSQVPYTHVYACFQYANIDPRPAAPMAMFAGLVTKDVKAPLGGLVYSDDDKALTLGLAATAGTKDAGFYRLGADLVLRRCNEAGAVERVKKDYAINGKGVSYDKSGVLLVDDDGRRYRFPVVDASFDGTSPFGRERVCREICTERDMLNVGGTFYEAPAENAGGFGKVRAIATHGMRFQDYCTWRGLTVLTGVDPAAPATEHLIRSQDGKAAVWVGAVDDLWQLGKPCGTGYPWKDDAVKANVPSDAFVMTGFDRKTLTFTQHGAKEAEISVEIDLTGTGVWRKFARFTAADGETVTKDYSDLKAYWIRLVCDQACTATARLEYR